MIERYTLPEMKQIWSEENKFRKWLDVEIYACEALAELVRFRRRPWPRLRKRLISTCAALPKLKQ